MSTYTRRRNRPSIEDRARLPLMFTSIEAPEAISTISEGGRPQ
jgi:hypothetical protein